MGYQTGIVAALQRFGLDVDTVSGWTTRGSSSFNPHGVVGHHTAGPKTGDRPSLSICVNGRPDLSGPLCNVFLPRGLTVAQQAPVVVAAGRANHAGEGGFRGLVGNSSVFGIEAEDDGTDGIWTDWQRWAYPRVVAGLLWLAGRDASWYCAHRTWAPDRKIDPTGISDTWMRDRVAPLLASPSTPQETPPAPSYEGEADMFLARTADPNDDRLFLVVGGYKRQIGVAVRNELRDVAKLFECDLSGTTLNTFKSLDGLDVEEDGFRDAVSARLAAIEAKLDALAVAP